MIFLPIFEKNVLQNASFPTLENATNCRLCDWSCVIADPFTDNATILAIKNSII